MCEPTYYGASTDCEIDEYLTWWLNGAFGEVHFVLGEPRPELEAAREKVAECSTSTEPT